MPDFGFILLYVENPAASAAFYADLLDKPVPETSPTFAMVPLRDGVMLGLWLRSAVEPKAAGAAGSQEIAFALASRAAVDETHAAWVKRGLPVIQAPCAMDFGYNFVATDPDGHRLRVLVPEGV